MVSDEDPLLTVCFKNSNYVTIFREQLALLLCLALKCFFSVESNSSGFFPSSLQNISVNANPQIPAEHPDVDVKNTWSYIHI